MTTPTMKIKSTLPYFGSKRSLAPQIVELIGDHRVYWDPFCGSLAVPLLKPRCEMETVNDLNGDVINLTRVIQHDQLAFKLYEKLTRTLYCEQLFVDAKDRWCSDDTPYIAADLERAYDFFVASWMGINGMAGTQRYNYCFAMRWCVGGGQGSTRWNSVVSSLPAWHKRLREIVIVNRDGFEIIEKINDEAGTVVYCDPPYFVKSSKYVYDFTSEMHDKLAELLARFKKARVIVSYYDHPRVDELYGDRWNKMIIKKSKANLANAANGNKPIKKKVNKEILLTNWKPVAKKIVEKQGSLFNLPKQPVAVNTSNQTYELLPKTAKHLNHKKDGYRYLIDKAGVEWLVEAVKDQGRFIHVFQADTDGKVDKVIWADDFEKYLIVADSLNEKQEVAIRKAMA